MAYQRDVTPPRTPEGAAPCHRPPRLRWWERGESGVVSRRWPFRPAAHGPRDRGPLLPGWRGLVWWYPGAAAGAGLLNAGERVYFFIFCFSELGFAPFGWLGGRGTDSQARGEPANILLFLKVNLQLVFSLLTLEPYLV